MTVQIKLNTKTSNKIPDNCKNTQKILPLQSTCVLIFLEVVKHQWKLTCWISKREVD